MPYYYFWSFQCATRVVQLLLPYLIGDDGEFLEFGDLGRVRIDMEIDGAFVNIGTARGIINKSLNGRINVDGYCYARESKVKRLFVESLEHGWDEWYPIFSGVYNALAFTILLIGGSSAKMILGYSVGQLNIAIYITLDKAAATYLFLCCFQSSYHYYC